MHHRLPVALSAAALAVAVLGSTPVATAIGDALLPANSVGRAQLKSDAVTGAKVANGTLRRVDFRGGELPAGQQGPKGERGEQGQRGEQGAPGVIGYESVEASTGYTSVSPKQMTVMCPPGKKLVGGGGGAWGRQLIHPAAGVALSANDPVDERTWVVSAHEVVPTDESWFLRVRAFCVSVS